MTWFLPWLLLFCLLFFFGMFSMIYFSVRSQDKALNAIFQQLKSTRMEVERLSNALDALLTEREFNDDDALNHAAPSAEQAEDMVPGLARLLLGPDSPQAQRGKKNSDCQEEGRPELKL